MNNKKKSLVISCIIVIATLLLPVYKSGIEAIYFGYPLKYITIYIKSFYAIPKETWVIPLKEIAINPFNFILNVFIVFVCLRFLYKIYNIVKTNRK